MRVFKITLLAVLIGLVWMPASHAGLLATYYNLSSLHPDMQNVITGNTPGMVESVLSGPAPTLTAYGATQVSQFDWWGLTGDPYHFAVHWTGQFYVAANQAYTYTMGSDDDSWLFIDDALELDLGGVHGLAVGSHTVNLTAGWHDIDIYFAERHTVESGFHLNFFSDLAPTTEPIPEPTTLLLVGMGLAGAGLLRRKRS
jgi:fibro-slime domain-containing protein